MTTTAHVVFLPSGKRGRFELNTPILECARRLGVDLDSVCGGRAICGRCQITVAEGDFLKHRINSSRHSLSPVSDAERKYSQRKQLKPERRLSCNARLVADVVIDVPEESQVHRQVVRKRAETRVITIDPVVKPYYVEVEKPDMQQPSGDFQRLNQALIDEWSITLHDTDLHVLRTLQSTLRKGDWKVTVAVRHTLNRYDEVIGVWPGFMDRFFGLAIDIGTTTISCQLCDMTSGEVLAVAGCMNPQIRFGEDLMSRVSYVVAQPAAVKEMSMALTEALNSLVHQTRTEAGVDPLSLVEVVIVGNPIMHHLALGIDPSELGLAPFALCTNEAVKVYAEDDLKLAIALGSRAYFFPCIAGHVGADAAAVVLSEGPQLHDEITLVVDVGTNAEIILGNKQRLLAASSPTGPAFEGAEISSGQRAAPGAIERLRIDPHTFEPKFKIIGCDLWSDQEGFSEAIQASGITGICGSGIIEVIGEMFLTGLLSADGVIDGALAARSARIQPHGDTFSYLIHNGEPAISIIQSDVRAIQLAKGALYAGVKLLMDRFGITRVDRISLAGAFGSHIDSRYAMLIGMIPDCPLDKVVSVGNAAGTGARIALLNKQARLEIEELVSRIEKIETAIEPEFQTHFINAMAFPNASDSFPNLQREITLPAAKAMPEKSAVTDARKISRRRARRQRLMQNA